MLNQFERAIIVQQRYNVDFIDAMIYTHFDQVLFDGELAFLAETPENYNQLLTCLEHGAKDRLISKCVEDKKMSMTIKQAINAVCTQGNYIEAYKGKNVQFLHIKNRKRRGLNFFKALDFFKNHTSIKVVSHV